MSVCFVVLRGGAEQPGIVCVTLSRCNRLSHNFSRSLSPTHGDALLSTSPRPRSPLVCVFTCLTHTHTLNPPVLCLQVTPLVIDDSLVAMCEVIADVKGWTMQEAADRLYDNFKSFYQQQL